MFDQIDLQIYNSILKLQICVVLTQFSNIFYSFIFYLIINLFFWKFKNWIMTKQADALFCQQERSWLNFIIQLLGRGHLSFVFMTKL
jgi:hypothetical protein